MVNFGEAAAGFDPNAAMVIPKGEYEVRIDSAEAKVAASSGREMISVKMVVEGGPQDGRQVYNNFVWVPEKENAVRMFFINMAHMGLDKAYFMKSPSMDQVASDITGKRVRVTIDHREYMGEMQPDVKRIKPSQGGASVPQMGSPAATPGPAMQPAPTAAAPTPAPTPATTTPQAAPSAPAPAAEPAPTPAAEAPAAEQESAPAPAEGAAAKPPIAPPF